jgi:hypothetical protein
LPRRLCPTLCFFSRREDFLNPSFSTKDKWQKNLGQKNGRPDDGLGKRQSSKSARMPGTKSFYFFALDFLPCSFLAAAEARGA